MSDAKEIIDLFERADRMIVEYISMMANTRSYIHSRIKKGVPLPRGVVVAIKEGREDDLAWLSRALVDLKDDEDVVSKGLLEMRNTLASAETLLDIREVAVFIMTWPGGVERLMETVVNDQYKVSDVLPPPTYYWKPISTSYRKNFINSADDPAGSNKQLLSVLHCLKKSFNPWS
ncbi:hypothetical protein [Paracoccus xiamenensis]|uniref:hypothetical protein n=1 Tax=Paracoccus xiamenensis TaxID=2714901 RepID=UPI00140A441F|nr:hypothetical protein [Paracoccus xiamenensis]NHF73783.1 hypothetical protein [Paracoccus xiamenensis]